MNENKHGFVNDFQEALIRNGAGRYDYLSSIYYEYTDLVEPFGLDESWIDVTGSLYLFGGNELKLAQEISETALKLILENQPLDSEHALRAIHVRTTNFVPMDIAVQQDLFGDTSMVRGRDNV